MRAIRARYNPYVQARARVDQLRKLGHSVDKVSQLCPNASRFCCVTLSHAHALCHLPLGKLSSVHALPGL